jgi:hypothetical protein
MEYYLFLALQWISFFLFLFTPFKRQFTILFFAFMLCTLIAAFRLRKQRNNKVD